MDVVDLVTRVRDHFIEQFGAFVEQQEDACKFGSPEVKLQMSPDSALYEQLYCVDFIKPSGEADESDEDDGEELDEDEINEGMVDFQPGFFLEFDPTSGTFGSMAVEIEQLRWDDVIIRHDLEPLPEDRIAEWFELWFDPEDERYDPEARFGGIIHSLLVEPGLISVDFGTAPVNAFWDLLELLESSGAKRAVIACTPEEDEE